MTLSPADLAAQEARCWSRMAFPERRCDQVGVYGFPEFTGPAETFVRAARWCLAHKHPSDRLLTEEVVACR